MAPYTLAVLLMPHKRDRVLSHELTAALGPDVSVLPAPAASSSSCSGGDEQAAWRQVDAILHKLPADPGVRCACKEEAAYSLAADA